MAPNDEAGVEASLCSTDWLAARRDKLKMTRPPLESKWSISRQVSSKALKCRPQALWSAPRNVLIAVGISSDMEEVVDLCSGDGWFTLEIAKRARSVVAIDIDTKLLEVARIRFTENKVTNCTFVAGDAYDVQKLVGRRTDFVFMANAFHGVPDKPRLAWAVYDTLKPGGRFAIINWHQRPREDTTVLGEPRGPRNHGSNSRGGSDEDGRRN
jgi:SAM-dependent methyltransferase